MGFCIFILCPSLTAILNLTIFSPTKHSHRSSLLTLASVLTPPEKTIANTNSAVPPPIWLPKSSNENAKIQKRLTSGRWELYFT